MAHTDIVAELAKILNDSELTEIEFKTEEVKIVVRKGGVADVPTLVAAQAAPLQSAPVGPSHAETASHAFEQGATQAAAGIEKALRSPMVGTVYTRPSPDAETFVKIGDAVKEGDTVLLVEAMKTFNPITADRSGTVESVLVEDGQGVEFDDPLIVIV